MFETLPLPPEGFVVECQHYEHRHHLIGTISASSYKRVNLGARKK